MPSASGFASGSADYMTIQLDRARLPNAGLLRLPQRNTEGLPVAVYGLGAIGAVIADRLAALGFAVHGWSRQPRDLGPFVQTFTALTGFARCCRPGSIFVSCP